MTKLIKQHYYTRNGEKKLNCFYISVPKKVVEEANLNDKELEIKAEGNKIIIKEK